MPRIRQHALPLTPNRPSPVLRAMRKVRVHYPTASKLERRELVIKRLDASWRKLFSNVKKFSKKNGVDDERDFRAIETFMKSLDDPDRLARGANMSNLGRAEYAKHVAAAGPSILPGFHSVRAPNKSFPYMVYSALRDPEPYARLGAIRRVAMVDSPFISFFLRYSAVRDPKDLVRQAAAEGLKYSKDDASRATLFRVIARDSDAMVKRAAIQSLGYTGTPETAAQLFYLYTRRGSVQERNALSESIRRIAWRTSGIGEAFERYGIHLEDGKALAIMVQALRDPVLRAMSPFDVADHLFDVERQIKKVPLSAFVHTHRLLRDKPPY